jgi:hypothetical protein
MAKYESSFSVVFNGYKFGKSDQLDDFGNRPEE